MLELRTFKTEDAELLCPNAIEAQTWDWKTWSRLNEHSIGFTGLLAGKPVAAAGIHIVRKGVGIVWAVFSPEIRSHKKDVLKSIRLWFESIKETYSFKELRATSRIGFKPSQTLLEHLGFTRMRKIINGTHYLYRLRMA